MCLIKPGLKQWEIKKQCCHIYFGLTGYLKRLCEICPGTHFLPAQWVNGWADFRFRCKLNWWFCIRYTHAPILTKPYANPLPTFYSVSWLNLIVHISFCSNIKRKMFWVVYMALNFPQDSPNWCAFILQNGSLILQCISGPPSTARQ